jgi:methionyl-tRNA synthetase
MRSTPRQSRQLSAVDYSRPLVQTDRGVDSDSEFDSENDDDDEHEENNENEEKSVELVNLLNETIDLLSKDLQLQLKESEKLKDAIEKEKNIALNDLDATLKKSQNEMIKIIVKSALGVILSVGVITTIMYSFAILSNRILCSTFILLNYFE